MLSKIPDTTKIVLFADSVTRDASGVPNGRKVLLQLGADKKDASGKITAYSDIDYRHNGGANIAFCDGHVKWHTPGSLYAAGGWTTLYGSTELRPYSNQW
jgi:prepilin-type processing-associated H-X9-DG protein